MCAQLHSCRTIKIYSEGRFCRLLTYLFRLFFILVFLSLTGCSNLLEQEHVGSDIEAPRFNPSYEIEGLATPGLFSIERVELSTKELHRNIQRSDSFFPVATIHYKGAGSLVGHWELDGRILEPFVVHLNRGSTVFVHLKNKINLAALVSGRHFLSLIVNQPTMEFQLPKLEFYLE